MSLDHFIRGMAERTMRDHNELQKTKQQIKVWRIVAAVSIGIIAYYFYLQLSPVFSDWGASFVEHYETW
jgi:hypothetical protein